MVLQFDGNSAQMEKHLRTLPEGEVVEIANHDNGPYANKAKAEIVRRNSEYNSKILFWTRIAVGVGIIAIVVTVGFELFKK